MAYQKKYRKDKLMQWLLSVTLLLSVFSFSGYSCHATSIRQAVQTEWVFFDQLKTDKETGIFKKNNNLNDVLSCFISTNYALNIFATRNKLSTYNTRVKVTFDTLSNQFRQMKPTLRFHHIKTIPQTSKVVTRLSFIG